MNFFIIFIQSILLISLIFFILFCYGETFLLTARKFINKKTIADYTIVSPLIGFSILIFLSNYLYFLFNLSSQLIYQIYLIIFIFIFIIQPNKKNLLKNFFIVLKKIIPIFSILIFGTLLKGEQFYIFRGNYWDNMNYISQAILINDFSFFEILNFPNPLDHSYVQHGTVAINVRPLTTFFLAGFFHTNILNFFYLSFLFKFFLLSLVFLSFYFLTKQIKLKYNYFISLAFIFSFWVFYIFESEALSHLNALPFFLLIIALILKLKKDCFYKTIEDYAIFLLANICFFFLYPEFFSIFVLVISLFFLLNYSFFFFKKNFLAIIFLIFLFLIFTLPNYKTTYLPLISQIKIGTSDSINYWGYFSSFFIGKDNDYLNEHTIDYVKYIFKNKNNFSYLFKEIYSIISQAGYNFIFLNLVPSFFGLYYLTISNFKNYTDIFIFTLVIFLNLFFIKILFRNTICAFNGKSILLRMVKSFILIFLIFAVFLVFNQSYWAFTKLYIYFGPVIFIFVFLNFTTKNNQEILSPNYWYIFLLLLFPFYKFYPENHGIGRLDSFPSIINPIYKKNINWNLDRSDLNSCKKVSIASKDPIINGYISIKLRYFGYVHSKSNNYKLDTSDFGIETNCNINLVEQLFSVNYEKK